MYLFWYTNKIVMSVIQVTSREFREKQASLFSLADKGMQVIIRRGKKHAYILTPVSEDDYDLKLSPEAEGRIRLAREQYHKGESTVCTTPEELHAYLASL